MNKVIDKGFRSCRFVSTIVKHPVHCWLLCSDPEIWRIIFRRRTFAFLPATDTFVIISAFYDCLWARCCILWPPNRHARFLRFAAKVHLSHCATWATCKQTIRVDNLPTVLTTNGKCILVKQDYRCTSIDLFFLNPLFWTSILGKFPVLHLWCDINRIQTFEKCMVQIIFHVCLF